MTPPAQSRWFLSTAPATFGERVIAIAVVGISFLAFLITIPYVRVHLTPVPAFIPAYQAALFFVDLITAVLLLGQFARLRSRALLALASGYLFDAAMIVPHTLSFPGVFAPTGLLGSGAQTTAWLYVFWHGGFPLFVLAYAYFRNRPDDEPVTNDKPAMVAAVAGVAAVAAALTVLTTAGHHLLPQIIKDGDYAMLVSKGISPAVWFLTLFALLAVWRRATAVLDLWLMVVMAVWLLDIALAAILGSSRFDLGFYAGRMYGLIAASIVLIALLAEMVRLYGHLTDALRLSEERNAELVHSREALTRAQRMEAISQISAGMAHDFNNLLTVICGNLELIGKTPGDPERVERMAGNAMTAAKRGTRLTRQLLTFGGRETSRPGAFDANRLIREFEPVLQRAAEKMELLTGLSSSLHTIKVDPTQFETALLNLIGNARDAGGSRVIIETRNVTLDESPVGSTPNAAPGAYVVVTVRDTGPGMSTETAARAFEPFFTTKKTGGNSGLGLSQVYGFVRNAGGQVRLDSQPGRGTSVHMYFPKSDRQTPSMPRPEPPRASAAASSVGNETILVVEDDADVLEVTLARLVDLGYGVRHAANAHEAIVLLNGDGQISLLFSDIVLPGGMNGFELAAQAQRIRPGLKVLLTSGHAAASLSQDRGTGLDILEKPYLEEELASRLRQVIGA